MLSPLHENIPSRKRGNLPCLHWLPQNYFRFACIMYATCTVCIMYTTLKFHLFSALGCEEIKYTSASLSITWLQQCLSIPHARLCSWMSHNFTIWMSWAETQVQFPLLCTWFLLKENHSTQQYLPRLNTHGVRTQSIRSIPQHCQMHTSTKSV